MARRSLPLGLYLHFPWCVRKCPYCDFNSHPLRGSLDEAGYLKALQADLQAALTDVAPGSIATVFCGGGTPSLFSADAFARLLDGLEPWLAVNAEITLEANPGTVEHHDFAAYRRAGINRLSLGAQSFDPGKLTRLGRIHRPEDTVRAFARARAGGFDDINLDIMYGLPEQTAAEAGTDLECALALEPEHISWYQLTLEPKTEFARRPPILPVDDTVAEMEAAGYEALATAGYQRYEISAYARPGRTCRHNVNYWQFGDYLGAGAGAHGKRTHDAEAPGLTVLRTRKASQPRLYLADPAATAAEPVAADELVFEFMMNALRLVDGASWACFEGRTGLPAAAVTAWPDLVAQELVVPDRVAATPLGLRHLDGVLQSFLR